MRDIIRANVVLIDDSINNSLRIITLKMNNNNKKSNNEEMFE